MAQPPNTNTPNNGQSKAMQQRVEEKALAPIEKKKRTLRQELARMEPEFQKALAGAYTGEWFARVLMTAANNSPKILDCTMPSIMAAAMHCAQLRLVPNTPLGYVHLIPFGDELQVVVGHQGWNMLAMRTGMVSGILAEAVCEGDAFTYDRTTGEITHDTKKRTIGRNGLPTVTGAWARAKLKDGSFTPALVLEKWELDRVWAFVKKRNGNRAHYSDSYPDRWAANSVTKRFIRTKLPLNEQMIDLALADQELREDAMAAGDFIDVPSVAVETDGTTVDAATGEVLDDEPQREDEEAEGERRYQQERQDEEPPPHGEPAPRPAPVQAVAPSAQQARAQARTELLKLLTQKKWTIKLAAEEAKGIGIETTDFKDLEANELNRLIHHFTSAKAPG